MKPARLAAENLPPDRIGPRPSQPDEFLPAVFHNQSIRRRARSSGMAAPHRHPPNILTLLVQCLFDSSICEKPLQMQRPSANCRPLRRSASAVILQAPGIVSEEKFSVDSGNPPRAPARGTFHYSRPKDLEHPIPEPIEVTEPRGNRVSPDMRHKHHGPRRKMRHHHT